MKPNKENHSALYEILAACVLLALLAGFIYGQYRSQLELIAEQHTKSLDVAYRATLETFRLDIATRFRLQVMRPEVLELMTEALATPEANRLPLRDRLYRLLRPVYEEFEQAGLKQFQFHLADDRSLLRFHLPKKSGDAIFALRPSVRIANTEKRFVMGLEVGRTLPAFRYVFPISTPAQHLGSAEISLPFERIQENMMRLLPEGDFGFVLNKRAIFDTVDSGNREKYAETGIHPDFLIENPGLSRVASSYLQSDVVRAIEPILRRDAQVQERMRSGDSFALPVVSSGQGYMATFLSVQDLTGRPVAYLIRFGENNVFQELRDGLIKQGMLAAVLLLVLAISVHHIRSQTALLAEELIFREQAASELRLYESIFSHSGEAILVTDQNNNIVAVNPAFTELTGYAFEEVQGRNPRMLSSGETSAETYRAMWSELLAKGHWQGELMDRRKNGEVFPKWTMISLIRDHHGDIVNHIASFNDISERKASEMRIERLAHYDGLTGLLNRHSLQSRLTQSLFAARRETQRLAVLFIDMDRFKSINDSLGHHMGDQLLKEVARRLRSVVRESDIVARQGGDEFVVVLTGLMEAHDAAPVVNKLLRALGENYSIEGHDLRSSPSIGIALYPDDGGDVETLLKNADTAMYHAKDRGRNNAQYFSTAMTDAANERMAMESDLCVALAERQFELYYQPQVRAADRRICGVEALLRWHHPQHGMVSPDRFIPVAEEAGLIHAIGAWVVDEACRQLAAWRAEGITDLRMAVNLSAHQLRSPELVRHVSECMARHGILPDRLELEITESTSMENPERAIGQLQALRDLGLTLAIDDFGTGYSSLAYLKHLPIQMLKLDRSFVRDIETDVNDAAISAATIALAHNLGLVVVAEGVENEVQANYLSGTHDCDFLQGYLFGRPEPAAALTETLRRRPASADFFGV